MSGIRTTIEAFSADEWDRHRPTAFFEESSSGRLVIFMSRGRLQQEKNKAVDGRLPSLFGFGQPLSPPRIPLLMLVSMGSWLLLAPNANAQITPLSQTRSVAADWQETTIVYSCIEIIDGRYFPACPGPPVILTDDAMEIAPDFSPFDQQITVHFNEIAQQTSSLDSDAIRAAGSIELFAHGSVTSETLPPWTGVVDEAHGESILDVTFSIAEAGAHSITGWARVAYDTDTPVVSQASFLLRLTDVPGGTEVASFELPHDWVCPWPSLGFPPCDSGQVPIDLSLDLLAGDHRLEITLIGDVEGGWLPSVGDLQAIAEGQYDVALSRSGASVPSGSAAPLGGLLIMCLGAGELWRSRGLERAG
jgi:hypothetical protein